MDKQQILKDLKKVLEEAKNLSLRLEQIEEGAMDELAEMRYYQEADAIVQPIQKALTTTDNMLLSLRVYNASQPVLFTDSSPIIKVEVA